MTDADGAVNCWYPGVEPATVHLGLCIPSSAGSDEEQRKTPGVQNFTKKRAAASSGMLRQPIMGPLHTIAQRVQIGTSWYFVWSQRVRRV